MNSLYVLLGFLAFVGLGYLSFVRIVYKLRFRANYPKLSEVGNLSHLASLTKGLAQSSLFVCLPAISILLFWGWGPALLWLVASHLLIDTLFNLFVSDAKVAHSTPTHFANFANGIGSIRASMSQLLLIVLLAITVSLLANLIDQQSGLIFTLVGVLLAIQLLQGKHNAATAVAKLVASIMVLTLCLLFSKQLGIAVYGSWTPFPAYAPWLSFGNSTLLALGLIFASIRFGANSAIRAGLQTLVGATIFLLIVATLFMLGVEQPLIDAPLISVENRSTSLPALPSLLFFINGGFLLLLASLVWLQAGHNVGSKQQPQIRFLHLQSLSLLNFLFALVLCIGVATAAGIGAWNTHFVEWNDSVTLQRYFTLVIDAFRHLTLVGNNSTTVTYTLFTSGLCLTGFSLLIFLFRNLIFVADKAREQEQQDGEVFLATALAKNQFIQAGLVFFTSCYFLQSGITIATWVCLMALGWVLLVDFLCARSAGIATKSLIDQLLRGFAVAIYVIGSLQLLWLGANYLLDESVIIGSVLLVLLLIATALCLRNLVSIANDFKANPNSSLFER